MPMYGSQSPNFWVPFAKEVARSFRYGIEFADVFTENTMATDRNRNNIVKHFLESGLEWSYWHDADNINPVDACARLLETARGGNYKIAAGVYYLKKEPYAPIALKRIDDNTYAFVDTWNRGEIIEIDATGMNCVLIHRDVYLDIQKNYMALQRLKSGGIVPVHKDDVVGEIPAWDDVKDFGGKLVNGMWSEAYCKPNIDVDLPWFFLEYNRTEDIPFFEMCRRVGYSIAMDTMVQCGHLREFNIDIGMHRKAELERDEQA